METSSSLKRFVSPKGAQAKRPVDEFASYSNSADLAPRAVQNSLLPVKRED